MNWEKGLSASYYAYIIDPVTWREKKRIDIVSGSISRSADGLRDSADVETKDYEQGKENYIRIYFDAQQRGSGQHEPLFTGLACSPSRDIDGVYKTDTLECYSVLKAAEDILLPRGYYVGAGANGELIIKELLSVIPAPVSVDSDAPSVRYTIIAEDGENRLSMTEKVLAAMNWGMHIDGKGTIHIAPIPMVETVTFDPLSNDIIEPSIEIEYDWYKAPNVFRAIKDEASAVARDDSQESPLSTVNRGREVWAEETSPNMNTGESLGEYVIRRLNELQETALTAKYSRRFMPNIYVGDVVRLHYPKQGLDGLFRVTSQNIDLEYGARTSEEVTKI